MGGAAGAGDGPDVIGLAEGDEGVRKGRRAIQPGRGLRDGEAGGREKHACRRETRRGEVEASLP